MNEEDIEDFIGQGFARIDNKYIDRRPPKIKWGKKYKSFDDGEKIRYLEKFACAMNRAAELVQYERNELNALCEKKEEKLVQMNQMLGANNDMLQQEVTRMNEMKQHFAAEMKELNAKLKELESADD